MGTGAKSLGAASLVALVAALGCRPQQVSVDSIEELPYPSCGGVALGGGQVVAEGRLRSGPSMREQDVVESFELRRRDCLFVGTVHQAWPLGVSDVEVVYDAAMLPLRAWRRTIMPGRPDAADHPDIRRYELRTPQVSVKRRAFDGTIDRLLVRGARPRAVITPGRGMLTAWIRRVHLGVGQKVREPVLDVRGLEVIREATLERLPDHIDPALGGRVRVYTFLGREAFYADQNDVVIGDLAGLRDVRLLSTPEPLPLPTYGAPDTQRTP